MEVIVGGRRTGRTTRLIEYSIRAGADGKLVYIVTRNHDAAYAISQKAEEMGYHIPFPLTFDEFLRFEYAGTNIDYLVLDDADVLLQQLAKIPLKIVVLEKEEEVDA